MHFMHFINEHLFVLSEFPICDNAQEQIINLFEEHPFANIELVDARLFSNSEFLSVLLKDDCPKIFWLGRNFHMNWLEGCFIEELPLFNLDPETVIFYEPSDFDLFFSLSDFTDCKKYDSWSLICKHFLVGRFGGTEN